MENQNQPNYEEMDQDPSWTPSAFDNSAHSKMDWMGEVPFRYVRGVEVHPEEDLEEADFHRHPG